uniref:YTH domain-containing protein 1-like n=1 Tax=Ciona intestinalis TaxID=7719 RepID=UPI000180CF2A|nr:YTH domain-containing protein 1-like [Ciona intestinalis]|eukprot:XP_002127950.1 YTH domain-containing protein 1-like [Ciona intestinalis]
MARRRSKRLSSAAQVSPSKRSKQESAGSEEVPVKLENESVPVEDTSDKGEEVADDVGYEDGEVPGEIENDVVEEEEEEDGEILEEDEMLEEDLLEEDQEEDEENVLEEGEQEGSEELVEMEERSDEVDATQDEVERSLAAEEQENEYDLDVEDNHDKNDVTVEFDTRSEASSDRNDDAGKLSDAEVDGEVRMRAISPIVFDREDSSSEEEEEENDDQISPPGESDVLIPKKEIVLPPAEIRVERRERHAKMLKYLFREAHFYLIKSNNHENVALAKARGVWSTPPSNEAKLNRSFREARNVILIYSVRESGAFQGFARLATEAKHNLSPIDWVLPAGLSAKALGGVFKIDWLCKRELSFAKTTDIYNTFNGNKPVKIGRDGQEVEPNAGKVLCLEFPHDDKVDLETIIQRVRKQQKADGGPPKFRPPQAPDDAGSMRGRIRERPGYKPYRDPNRTRTRTEPRLDFKNQRGRTDRPRNDYNPRRTMSNGSYNHAIPSNHRGPPVLFSEAFPPLYAQPNFAYYPDPFNNLHASGQPSSAVVSSGKYSQSSRTSRSSRNYDDSSTPSRIYDSRSHAAACDDFVRRVAGGKISSTVTTASRSSRSSSSYGRSSSRQSERRSEKRYSRR